MALRTRSHPGWRSRSSGAPCRARLRRPHLSRPRLRLPRRDDGGFALIVALLATMVVLTMSGTAVALSLHNEDASALNRNQTDAIDAAEAGIDLANQQIQTSGPCNPSPTGNLSATPTASYSVTVTYYDSSGTQLSCPLAAGATPASAAIVSAGTSPTGSALAATQTMKELVNLSPVHGAVVNAVQTHARFTANSGVDLYGDGNGNDADVYTDGDWTCNSGGTFRGSVYSQGNITLNSGCTIDGTLWAKGSVVLNSGDTINGNVISSTSTVTLNSGVKVYGNVTSASGCTGCTGRGNVVTGTVTQESQSGPPIQTYPQINFNASDWTGYTVLTYPGTVPSCSQAQADITAGFSTPTVVRITDRNCSLIWNSGAKISVTSNLAIVTDGTIILNSGNAFTGSGSPEPTLSFIVPYTDNGSCPSITFNSGNTFKNLYLFVYMPPSCTFNNNSGNKYSGQIIVGKLTFNSGLKLTYHPTLVPGAGSVTSYTLSVAYLQQIPNQPPG